MVGIDTYGESAPAGVLFKHFGFTTENVVDTVRGRWAARPEARQEAPAVAPAALATLIPFLSLQPLRISP